MVKTRRRYDTGALVDQLNKSRLASILMAAGGACLVLAITVYYASRGSDLTERAADRMEPARPTVTPAAPPPVAAPPSAPDGVAKPEQAAVAAPPVAAEATFIVSLSRPGPVWVNSKLVAKKAREHQFKMPAGKVVLRTPGGEGAKLVQVVQAEPGATYRVGFDQKKNTTSLDGVEQSAKAATSPAGSPPK